VDLERLRQVVAQTPDAPVDTFARIGKYTIEREIARGGMGAVYRATDPDLRRTVALKVLLGSDAEDAVRLYREARAAARLQHPNIVGIHDVGDDAGRHYIAMDYIDGPTLRAARLPTRRAVEVLASVASAVQFAHEQGVIHRDLKPDNILIAADGRAVVSDFGLARIEGASRRLTKSGDMCGTPVYMSPEQVRGKGVGPRSDVYALGVILYEILTGTVPFNGATLEEICVKIVTEDAVRPSLLKAGVDRDLENVALKAIAPEPETRYSSAGELGADLRRWLAGEPVHGRAPSTLRRVVRVVRRHPTAASLAGALVLAVAVGAYFVWAVRAMDRRRMDTVHRVDAVADRAIASYQNSLMGQPAPLDREREELERVRSELVQLFAENPEAVEVMVSVGRIHAELGRFDEAMACVTQAIDRLGPRATGAHYFRRAMIRVSLVMDRWFYRGGLDGPMQKTRTDDLLRQARQDLEEAARRGIDPRAGHPGFVEALGHYVRGDYRASVGACGRMLADESLVRPLRGDVYALRGYVAMVDGDMKLAVESFDEAAAIKRSDVNILVGGALARLKCSGSAESVMKGVQATENAVLVDPSRPRAWVLMAALWGDFAQTRLDREDDPMPAVEKALAALERAHALDAKDPMLFEARAGARLMRAKWSLKKGEDPAGELDAALADAETASALEADNWRAVLIRGLAWQVAAEAPGREREALLRRAVDEFSHVLRLRPGEPRALMRRGVARSQLGATRRDVDELAGAIDDLRGVGAGVPQQAFVHQELGYAYYHRALIERRVQDVDDAIAAFSRSATLDALLGRGSMHAFRELLAPGQGSASRAIADFREAVRRFPRAGRAHALLGDALYQNRDYRGAASAFEQAFALDPRVRPTYERIYEDCLRRIGEKP
jgi:serine/threonine-protein kinase